MQKDSILIVDDDPDIAEALQTRLEQENFECLTAYDGNGDLELARAQKPDLTIFDVMLPNLKWLQGESATEVSEGTQADSYYYANC